MEHWLFNAVINRNWFVPSTSMRRPSLGKFVTVWRKYCTVVCMSRESPQKYNSFHMSGFASWEISIFACTCETAWTMNSVCFPCQQQRAHCWQLRLSRTGPDLDMSLSQDSLGADALSASRKYYLSSRKYFSC